MKNEYKIVRVFHHNWVIKVKVVTIVKRLFWWDKKVVEWKTLNVLGTPVVKPNRNRLIKRKICTPHVFKGKWDAEAKLRKIKKRIENKI